MKPEEKSTSLLGATRARAKMHEYEVSQDLFNTINADPQELLFLTIRILGSLDESGSTSEARSNMLFAAQYFDSYVSSKLEQSLNNYLLLLGSAAYYLCDLPGSSLVLANKLLHQMSDLGGEGLDFLLRDLLINGASINIAPKNIQDQSREIREAYSDWRNHDDQKVNLFNSIEKLRSQIYAAGSDRALLLIDTIYKVISKQVNNSTRNRLPVFTGIDISLWDVAIRKASFIKEFWPSQILLGEQGVYKGVSAVIQMPTSAGKTKSIEIIIRSSLLSSRSTLAVIVAPFKSLCNEIKLTLQQAFIDEDIEIDVPSDAMQMDFGSESDMVQKATVLIVTPEKLIYMIRHNSSIIDKIGLLIYDEGHQFDNGIRGVTYELLLSSLRLQTPASAQVIIISAVISNAQQIGQWLIGDEIVVVDGVTLVPTYRTIGFVSWKDMLGRIEFVKANNPDEDEFYVPRVLQTRELNKKKRETKRRYFPEKSNGKSIAVFLGLKLAKNGMIAIFCGSKATVIGISKNIQELTERGYATNWPSNYSNHDEQTQLHYLHEQHFGQSYVLTRNCQLGVFVHTSTTPTGIRQAVEYAAQHSLIKFIICTSTLAQGVNLPIKYLMVTSFYQASEKIKTRDFHNLIGRAGRAGLHTEGSIIFTDPEIYDNKQYNNNNYQWELAKELLDPTRSEPCSSTILTIFSSITSADRKHELSVAPIEVVQAYVDNPGSVTEIIHEIVRLHAEKNFTESSLKSQFEHKISIIASIESFLMSHWESSNLAKDPERVRILAESTLAFTTGSADQKEQIVELFRILANNVQQKVGDSAKKQSYGKTLFGVQDILDIENWVGQNIQLLTGVSNSEELLEVIWDLAVKKLHSQKLDNLLPTTTHFEIVKNWVSGQSYHFIFSSLPKEAYRKWGIRTAKIEIDYIVEILDKAIAYDSTLLIGAIIEVVKQNHQPNDNLVIGLELLQKMLKYGLPSLTAIAIYELGFSDRIIAQKIATAFPSFSNRRPDLVRDVRNHREDVSRLLDAYPSYFKYILGTI